MRKARTESTKPEEPDLLAASRGRGSGPQETISFRVGGPILALLAERSAIQDQSLHQYARALVVEALFQGESMHSLQSVLSGSEKELHQLRSDLAFFMKTLLMTAGKMPEQAAKDWVERNFHL